MENVKKAREGVIPLHHPLVGFFRGCQGEGALRAQETKKIDKQPDPALPIAVHFADGRGRESEKRILAEDDVLVAARDTLSNPRVLRESPFQQAHQHKEIELRWLNLCS